MDIKKFIKANRNEIDRVIKQKCNNCRIDDNERELWVLNDEFLYRWAKSKRTRRDGEEL